jgi:hypothetical protein
MWYIYETNLEVKNTLIHLTDHRIWILCDNKLQHFSERLGSPTAPIYKLTHSFKISKKL